jgi:hypothetical protein
MAEAEFKIKYRGDLDYKEIYTQAKKLFKSEDLTITETKYKDKGKEFEGVWKTGEEYDEYTALSWEVEFKAWDMKTIQKDGKEIFNGKFQITITGEAKENYETDHFGNKTSFKKKGIIYDLLDKFGAFGSKDAKKRAKKVSEKVRDKIKELLSSEAVLDG